MLHLDLLSPPGDTLEELLDDRGMTQAQLAERTDLTPKTINLIVKGKAAITPETALAFERVFGMPASFWNTREAQYRDALARRAEAEAVDKSWQALFPFGSMVKAGLLPNVGQGVVERTRALLDYFGVGSPAAFGNVWMNPAGAAAFRRSLATTSQPYAIAAWLRAGEKEAAARENVASYTPEAFDAALAEARTLTNDAPEAFLPRLEAAFARAGVVFVMTPEVKGAPICGATRWLTPDRALVQISLRYRTNDHFWFTVFHESGHVRKHGKRDVFLEECGDEPDAAKEAEADRFAQDWLIPRAAWNAFVARADFYEPSVLTFAQAQGIAPGIVVGRLQHERLLDYRFLNHLKQRFAWIPESD